MSPSNEASPRSAEASPRSELSGDATPRSADLTPRSSDITPRSTDITPRSRDVSPRSYAPTENNHTVTFAPSVLETDGEEDFNEPPDVSNKKKPIVPILVLPPEENSAARKKPTMPRKAALLSENQVPRRSSSFHIPRHEIPNLRKKRASLTGLENLRHLAPFSEFRTKKVMCRICEEEISASLLKEHSKFCCIANTWDMIALESHDALHKVIAALNEKIEQADDLNLEKNHLITLRKIAQRYNSVCKSAESL